MFADMYIIRRTDRRHGHPNAQYLYYEGGGGRWTANPDRAFLFSTREDAESVLSILYPFTRTQDIYKREVISLNRANQEHFQN